MQNLSSAAVVIGALRVNIHGIKIRRFFKTAILVYFKFGSFSVYDG